ncbi:uncharacterized protein LOC130869315 [Chionomys nivalis]|uniref:uncharacterized protein LOC130869315 n=1 Tax=Chionomys nivalis TaxID=269649 RepID=UPI002591D006|nr:uncharacterized protein LOC130869315 [Chionomys nivalis]
MRLSKRALRRGLAPTAASDWHAADLPAALQGGARQAIFRGLYKGAEAAALRPGSSIALGRAAATLALAPGSRGDRAWAALASDPRCGALPCRWCPDPVRIRGNGSPPRWPIGRLPTTATSSATCHVFSKLPHLLQQPATSSSATCHVFSKMPHLLQQPATSSSATCHVFSKLPRLLQQTATSSATCHVFSKMPSSATCHVFSYCHVFSNCHVFFSNLPHLLQQPATS